MKPLRFLNAMLVSVLVCGMTASSPRASGVHAAPPITAMSASPDGSTLAVGSQAGISVLSLPDLKPIKTLVTTLAHVHDLVYSTDGNLLVAVGGQPAVEGSLEIWQVPEGRLQRRLMVHEDLIYRVALSTDGEHLATASGDGTCRVCLLASVETRSHFIGHSRSVVSVGFMPDRTTLVSAGADHTIRLWRQGSDDALRTLSNHVAPVTQVAVAPRQGESDTPTVMASISEDRTLRLWQPMIGRLVRFTKFPTPPTAIVWLPDGDRIVVSCRDGTLWKVDAADLERKQLLAEQMGRVYELVYVKKHRAVIAAGDFGVKLIELR